ncbi:hypothetical protein BGZ95_004370 [Linnemannia exigua]|uniref:Uncharacterized protein n=1 Tax=Linnemannia exigua TaxID=604196 RepID=A0AAD4DJM6_9FUNG|nr:hypothetical protein BGZ95_004370 [Linnemannia exigua]
MDPIITSFATSEPTASTSSRDDEHDTPGSANNNGFYFKKVHVPLAYPSEAIQQSTTKAYLSIQGEWTVWRSTSQIFILFSFKWITHRIHANPANPESNGVLSNNGADAITTSLTLEAFNQPDKTLSLRNKTPYPDLPAEVRAWSSAHVAEYLAYSLRRYPRAITEDLGRYVRQRMEINLKWRSMIMKAVGMLRRETLRASRIDSMNWEDGYDPEKDNGLQTVSPAPSSPTQSDEEDRSLGHSTSATTSSDATHSHSQDNSQSQTQPDSCSSTILFTATTITPTTPSLSSANTTTMENSKTQEQIQPIDAQDLRRGIVEDISSILLSWKKDQEAALAKKAAAAESSSIGGLGFMEGVVIGGLIVAFMMRFAR